MRFLILLGVFFTANIYAAPGNGIQEGLRLAGKVDVLSDSHLILSDRFIPVSPLISCYDLNGKKLVTCSSIKEGIWVEVLLSSGKDIANSRVLEIRSISEREGQLILKELYND